MYRRARSKLRSSAHLGFLAGVALSLPAIASCALQPDISMRIDTSILAVGEALDSEARVSGGTSTAFIFGQIPGEQVCDILSGDVNQDGSHIVVELTMISDVNFCGGERPTTFSYIVTVVNIVPGDYKLSLRHRYRGTDRPNETMLERVPIEIQ